MRNMKQIVPVVAGFPVNVELEVLVIIDEAASGGIDWVVVGVGISFGDVPVAFGDSFLNFDHLVSHGLSYSICIRVLS